MIDWHDPSIIEQRIKAAGFTVAGFARYSGVSRSSLIRHLGGEHKPRWETQRKIEAALESAQNNDDAPPLAAPQSNKRNSPKGVSGGAHG